MVGQLDLGDFSIWGSQNVPNYRITLCVSNVVCSVSYLYVWKTRQTICNSNQMCLTWRSGLWAPVVMLQIAFARWVSLLLKRHHSPHGYCMLSKCSGTLTATKVLWMYWINHYVSAFQISGRIHAVLLCRLVEVKILGPRGVWWKFMYSEMSWMWELRVFVIGAQAVECFHCVCFHWRLNVDIIQ